MEINVTNDEYCKGDPENKIMTLKKFIEMRQMTLNDPKFDIKKSRDTGRRTPTSVNESKKIFLDIYLDIPR